MYLGVIVTWQRLVRVKYGFQNLTWNGNEANHLTNA